MPVIKKKPEVVQSKEFEGREMETHPAFGLVRVSRISSTGTNLFDSEIDHRELIEITFHSAAVERDGYSNRIRRGEDRKPLFVARLSQAQWAAMVSSFGFGEGVPCTLSKVRDGSLVNLPEIEKLETMHERFSKDIAARVKKDITNIEGYVCQLGAMIASGKIGKRELREIHNSLLNSVINLPGNMAFGTELTQEAVDHIVSSGKAEVEAYIAGAAMRLGLSQISADPTNDVNESIRLLLEGNE